MQFYMCLIVGNALLHVQEVALIFKSRDTIQKFTRPTVCISTLLDWQSICTAGEGRKERGHAYNNSRYTR